MSSHAEQAPPGKRLLGTRRDDRVGHTDDREPVSVVPGGSANLLFDAGRRFGQAIREPLHLTHRWSTARVPVLPAKGDVRGQPEVRPLFRALIVDRRVGEMLLDPLGERRDRGPIGLVRRDGRVRREILVHRDRLTDAHVRP